MRRVVVVGTSGSGKTTLASRLAAVLGVPHVELDALHHLPDWVPRDTDDFRRLVTRATDAEAWVVDGNYRGKVQDIVLARADTVVWLDPSRAVVMWRVVTRTLARIALRRRLWNGNRERWRNFFTLDPQESVIVWAWTTHGRRRREYGERAASPEWGHLRVLRLRGRRDGERLLRSLSPEVGG